MAEQLKTRTRRRRIATTTTDTTKKLQEKLEHILSIEARKAELQRQIDALSVEAGNMMESLGLPKYYENGVEAVYDHPPQRNTTDFDTAGLFEAVSPEDFVASVKVQKGLAEKVIDPKILAKYSATKKSELKPKTLKVKRVNG